MVYGLRGEDIKMGTVTPPKNAEKLGVFGVASKFELQVLEDMELNRHRFSETALRELENHMSLELNRDYRIPETERQKLKIRNNYGL